MNRQSPYPDANTVPYANNAQLHQMSAQRTHQVSGMNTPMSRADSIPAADHDHYYGHKRRTPLAHTYHEATGNPHRKQRPGPTTGLENKGHVDRPESQEQDMEIGYEDNPAPLNFQAMEKKFQEETLNLLKEQVDAEDVEIIRHKEKIIEISNQYQEKLSVLRAQQAKQREEFLRKESQARLHSYQQQSVTSHLPGKVGLIDDHGYIPEPSTGHLSRKVGSIDNHGYIPEASTGHLVRNVGSIDNHGYVDDRGYIPEATTRHLARKDGPIDGRVYVTDEPNVPNPYQAYSAVKNHNQQPDRAAIRTGRVPMPYGRVYNNSGAGV